MTDYTKATNFATKDSLPSGNPAKIVKGTEIDTEFNSIATAIATKANKASPVFTGTLTAANISTTGNTSLGNGPTDTLTINGVLVTATPTELNFVDGVTSNIQTQLDALQDLDADLTAIAALTPTDSNFIVGNGTTWVQESGATVRTSLGLTIGTDVQAYSPVLAATTASFTTADETKLDGIETGATADQTASEILTALLTVDGTGTGLDADLLDGNHSTAFATAAQGALADSALQSSDIGVSVQGYDATLLNSADIGVTVQGYSAVLAATTASFTTAEETKLAGIQAGAQVNDPTTLLDADIGVNVLAYDSNLQSFVTAFTLPTVDSTAGYVLKTDGAGTLSFVAQSAYDESTVAITGGTINGTTIGATTPSTGSFSSLNVSGSDVVVDTDIGVTVQAYDADTTKNDVANTFTANQTFDNGIIEEYNATGTSGAVTIDLDTGNNFSTAMAGAVTYTFSNAAASGKVSAFTLKVVNDGNAITWPTSVDWPAATAPTLSASGATDYFVFITHDGGTTWYGFTAGQAIA